MISIYSNSEYVYAIFSIAVSLPRGKGGREIAESRPLSMISAMLSHVLNTMDVNNYSVRTTGKWHCGDTRAKWSPPLTPREDSGMSPNGPNPRSVGEDVDGKFYGFFIGLRNSKVRKDVLVGGARSRKFVCDIQSRRRIADGRFRNGRFTACVCKAGWLTSGSDNASVAGVRS